MEALRKKKLAMLKAKRDEAARKKKIEMMKKKAEA